MIREELNNKSDVLKFFGKIVAIIGQNSYYPSRRNITTIKVLFDLDLKCSDISGVLL